MHRLPGKRQRISEGKMSSPTGGARAAGLFIVALLLFSLLASGCRQSRPAASSSTTALPAATATMESVQQPPLVVAIKATPTDLPSFSLESAEEMAGPTPTISPTSALTATATAAPVVAAVITATVAPTAGPTFTPPAAPESSSNEHYWFNRPVAPGGTVWTDKHYPYGSTRGGQLRAHHGVEFNVPYNTEILAVAPGTVVVAGSDAEAVYGPHPNFYGKLVVIRHDFQHVGQPVFSLYGHLNEVLVGEGQRVGGQEVIGLSGATGVADGPHVHLEVRVGANSYAHTRNPLLWLNPFPGRGTIAGRVVWPDGQPATEAPVSLHRVDGEAPYYGTTTYAGSSVNADPGFGENFAIDDVVAGFYRVVVNSGQKKYEVETWVYPRRTSFVEIVLE